MVINFKARGISRDAQAGPNIHVKLKKKSKTKRKIMEVAHRYDVNK
jgi:hypothetical protein